MDIIVHPRFLHTLNEPPFQADHCSISWWRKLPYSVLLNIFSFLHFQDLLRMQQTCTELNCLAKDNMLWRSLCIRRFQPPHSVTVGTQCPNNLWLELYKFNHCVFLELFRNTNHSTDITSSRSLHIGNGPLIVHAGFAN